MQSLRHHLATEHDLISGGSHDPCRWGGCTCRDPLYHSFPLFSLILFHFHVQYFAYPYIVLNLMSWAERRVSVILSLRLMEVNVVETLVKLLQAEEETEELPEQVSCADCLKSLLTTMTLMFNNKIEMQKIITSLLLKAFKWYIVRWCYRKVILPFKLVFWINYRALYLHNLKF